MAKYTAAQRAQLAKEDKAMPDGSFPIVDQEDLKNAVSAFGLGTNNSSGAIKAFIKRRAAALGLTSQVPKAWSTA